MVKMSIIDHSCVTIFCGQTSDYPSNQVIDGKCALLALKHYILTGKPSPDLPWEKI